jgi:hypothetical protein
MLRICKRNMSGINVLGGKLLMQLQKSFNSQKKPAKSDYIDRSNIITIYLLFYVYDQTK